MKKHITYTHFFFKDWGKLLLPEQKDFFYKWRNDCVSDSQCGSLKSSKSRFRVLLGKGGYICLYEIKW